MHKIARIGAGDKIYNNMLGKNCRIITNKLLKNDPKLNQFFNNETMGALDNYAQHENLNIFISALENDLFHDVAVSVFGKNDIKAKFPMNVAKTKEEVPQFFRELYNKIHKATHTSEEPKLAPKTKTSKWEDFKTYAQNITDRFNNARLSILDKV